MLPRSLPWFPPVEHPASPSRRLPCTLCDLPGQGTLVLAKAPRLRGQVGHISSPSVPPGPAQLGERPAGRIEKSHVGFRPQASLMLSQVEGVLGG